MNLFKSHLCVIDFETTGIIGKHAWTEAIELAAVLLTPAGEEVDTWSALIRPEYLGPEIDDALKINHITREELLSQMPAGGVLPSFLGWWNNQGRPWLTSFNLNFDRPVAEKMGFRTDRWAACIMVRAQNRMAAAGALPQFRNGQYKWPSLAEAGTFFAVPPCEPAHRALADARRAALIACAIRRRELGIEPNPSATPADPSERSAS